MAKRKEYSELRFTDDFMFCKIMTAKLNLCKELLELILSIKIREVKISESQKTIEEKYDGRGIRLDVYVEDLENTVYDLEMQTTKKRDLPKRMRYYQGMIDTNLISRGAKFKELKKSYIIFICTDDPFNKNLPIYIFENVCLQDKNICLNDDAYKVVVNAKGSRENLSDEMVDFLDFLQGKENDGKLSKELDNAVKEAIADGLWKEEYNMTWQMKIDEEREDAAINATIRSGMKHNDSDNVIISDLMSDFQLTEQEAIDCIAEYKESLLQPV